jgi:uncharacterized protein (TIGR02271 family)
MEARNYTTNDPGRVSNRVVAFFRDRDDAYRALTQLKSAGFSPHDLGLAVGADEEKSTTKEMKNDESFWQKVKDFFSGEASEPRHDEGYRYQNQFRDATGTLGWSSDRYDYYEHGIAAGGAVVTVTSSRIEEARRILEENGGDLREQGFGTGTAERRTGTQPVAGEQRIHLRGEMLRTYKDRVQRGEVTLRKEVVTEHQTVDVPVTREELVIERTPGSGPAQGEIGSDKEVRIPLSEEKVRVEKQPIVTEEVRVGKREVQTNQPVSGEVRHEELHVDRKGKTKDEREEPPEEKKRVA